LRVLFFAVLLPIHAQGQGCVNQCTADCGSNLATENLAAGVVYQNCLTNPANKCQTNPKGFACENCTIGYNNTIAEDWNRYNACLPNCCNGGTCVNDCSCDCGCYVCGSSMNIPVDRPPSRWWPFDFAPLALAACFIRIRRSSTSYRRQ